MMAEPVIISITPVELKQRLDNGEDIPVIDVREDWELEITSLPFARQIRMVEILRQLDKVPKDRPVVIMCRSGSRSSRTIEMMQLKGYTNLLNLDGGILAWAREVDPTMVLFYT
jgi:rhodanese-related sulfurtransferase